MLKKYEIVSAQFLASFVWKDNGGADITTSYTRCTMTLLSISLSNSSASGGLNMSYA